MSEYDILKVGKDFRFVFDPITNNTKGSRYKRVAIDTRTNETVYFKYEKYCCSESCSEKMSYEIAKVLGYPCAHIEFGEDEEGTIGVLNYLFVNPLLEQHSDAISYLLNTSQERKVFYTIPNIKNSLDAIDSSLFRQFLKIMVFDALVGETDRHEENWGITKDKDGYRISFLYDNGCNLLREFKKEEFAQQYYTKKKDFSSYVKGAKSCIYQVGTGKRYSLLSLIEYLYREYPVWIREEIENLSLLTEEKIQEIVEMVPRNLLTTSHKKYIIRYLTERKKLLENMIEQEEK